MANYTFQIPVGTSQRTYTAVIDTTTFFTYNDNYKEDPQIRFEYNADILFQARIDRCFCYSSRVWFTGETYEGRHAMSIEDMVSSGEIRCFSTDMSTSFITTKYHESGGFDSWGGAWETDTQYLPYYAYSWTDTEVRDINNWVLSTNIPIFETTSEMNDYILNGTGITNAVNYDVPAVEELKDFQISCVWTHGTVSASGITPGSSYNYKMVRGKLAEGARVSLYKIAGLQNGALLYGVTINGRLSGIEYSTDGTTWLSSDNFPFDSFYRQPMDGDPYGTYDFAVSFYSEFPTWENKEDSDDYISGDKDISEAPNFPLISNNYPTHNETGTTDDVTEFGQVYSRSFFTNQYICSTAAIQQIANALFSTTASFWEDLKKGLATYIDPIESVVSLMYYPVDLNTVFTNTANLSYVYFGGYKFDFSDGVTVNQILFADGSFDIAGEVIRRSTHSWRDLPPFTKVFIDLPYCGRYELDPTLYYDKVLSVKYFIDTHTGGCVACVMADNHCYDQFNGQIGTQLPVTLTSFSDFANAQINTLLGNGGQAVNSALSIGTNTASGASGLAVAGGVASVAGLGAIQGAKTVYGLTQNNINKFNKTRGGSSAMLNQYLNQKVTITFETMELDNPAAFNALKGQPSNRSGNVGSFYGYFEAEQVKLNMEGATESEKDKARALLMNGVYI